MNKLKRSFFRTHGKLAPIPNNGNLIDVFNINGKLKVVLSFDDKHFCADATSSFLQELSTIPNNAIAIPKVPKQCYSACKKNTGGLGVHTRWCILDSKSTKDSFIHILVGLNNNSMIDFMNLKIMNTLMFPREEPLLWVDTEAVINDTSVVAVCVVKTTPQNLKHVAAFLTFHGYYVELENEEDTTKAMLACERLDRAEHMWVHQCKNEVKNAGPLRKDSHWKQNYTPWKDPAFTWQSLAAKVLKDINNCQSIVLNYPQPLQNYLINELSCKGTFHITNENLDIFKYILRLKRIIKRIEETGHCDHTVYNKVLCIKQLLCKQMKKIEFNKYKIYKSLKINSQSNMQTNVHLFMNKLSEEQEEQLLTAHWYYNIGPCSEELSNACRLILFAYLFYGYYVRTIAEYQATAKNVGRGEFIRNLNEDQYNINKLPMEVINRVYRKDGPWKGVGFRGSKGRHLPSGNIPVYQPKIRRKKVPVDKIISNDKPIL